MKVRMIDKTALTSPDAYTVRDVEIKDIDRTEQDINALGQKIVSCYPVLSEDIDGCKSIYFNYTAKLVDKSCPEYRWERNGNKDTYRLTVKKGHYIGDTGEELSLEDVKKQCDRLLREMRNECIESILYSIEQVRKGYTVTK